MIYITHYDSPMGDILLAEKNNALTGLWIEGQENSLDSAQEDIIEKNDTPVFRQIKAWLDRYFAGEKLSLDGLKLAPAGSDFRMAVWKILCEIPYGRLMTYGEIAGKIAADRGIEKMSAQAVGGAVGSNPISIIIPCHRVVGTNGNLTGYAGGIDKKIRLLTLEGVDMSNLFVPKKSDL